MPEVPLIPGGNPEDPAYRKPPGGFMFSLQSIRDFFCGKPDEEKSVDTLNDELQREAEEQNKLPPE